MRYEFGIMDYAQFSFYGTALECSPHFTITLKENIKIDKLKEALDKALIVHPIFKTKFVYDKKPYLETNDKEILIENTDNPIKYFGKNTNDYLFRVYYKLNKLYFDFNHGITDGRGFARFITSVLEFYFNLECSYKKEPYIKGFEEVMDKNIKPIGMKKQKSGFNSSILKHTKNDNKTKLTTFKLTTSNLLSLSKKYETTPTAILLPLLSKALYHSLDIEESKRRVKGYFTADFRKVMGVETGRNFIGYKHITYDKSFEKYDLETLGTIYRSIIDLFLQKENIIDFCNRFNKETSFITYLKPRCLSRFLWKIVSPIAKSDTNLYITYIGKLAFCDELTKKISDVEFVVYPDTGYLTLALLDFNGTINMSLTNKYKTDKIEKNFIKLLNDNNIDFKASDTIDYVQASYRP